MLTLNINGKLYTVDVEPETPLLWVIRDTIGLTGTKYGCGIAQCGACTVHIGGKAVRSCVTLAGSVTGTEITTIEGIVERKHHPVLAAWIAENVPQCGYCQPGQIMTAIALLDRNPSPTDADIDRAMTNICRCGTYADIRKAVHRAARMLKG